MYSMIVDEDPRTMRVAIHQVFKIHWCIDVLYCLLFYIATISIITGELGYDGPLYDGFLHMTDYMLGPSSMHIKYASYVYDGFCI